MKPTTSSDTCLCHVSSRAKRPTASNRVHVFHLSSHLPFHVFSELSRYAYSNFFPVAPVPAFLFFPSCPGTHFCETVCKIMFSETALLRHSLGGEGQAMKQGLFHSLPPPPGYDAKVSLLILCGTRKPGGRTDLIWVIAQACCPISANNTTLPDNRTVKRCNGVTV